MSAAHPRPDPVAADDARFWDSVAAGELRIQRCAACGTTYEKAGDGIREISRGAENRT